MMANVRFHNFIANENNDRFEERLNSFWRLSFIFLYPFATAKKTNSNKAALMNSIATFLVMERSRTALCDVDK